MLFFRDINHFEIQAQRFRKKSYYLYNCIFHCTLNNHYKRNLMATQAPTPPPMPRMDNLVGVYNINNFCQIIRDFLMYVFRNNRLAIERALTNLTNAYN